MVPEPIAFLVLRDQTTTPRVYYENMPITDPRSSPRSSPYSSPSFPPFQIYNLQSCKLQNYGLATHKIHGKKKLYSKAKYKFPHNPNTDSIFNLAQKQEYECRKHMLAKR